jgi:prepilin-type N-terminal cleavage/methylation domain-containing protein
VNDRTGEAGFTLIEMVLAMSIAALVIGVLAAAMFLGLGTEHDVQTRLAESNSANLLASYFGPDMQQSGPVSIAPAASDAPYCGAAGGPVALLLPQNNNASSVSYFVDPTSPKVLRRRTCAGGAPTGPPSGIAVVRNLSATPAAPDCHGSTCTIQVTQLVSGKLPYTTTLTGSRRVQ